MALLAMATAINVYDLYFPVALAAVLATFVLADFPRCLLSMHQEDE